MKHHKLQLDNSMWKGANAEIFSKAKKLRENMTHTENLLWSHLESNKFFGLKFRRQHPIQNYIADFYCHKLKLIIEIDGEYHNSKSQKKSDKERTDNLNFNEVNVIRFTNEEVENHINEVLNKIKTYII